MGIWKSQSSGSGTTNHSELTNRDAAGNHAKLIPSADGASAVQITKADGTTPVLSVDTLGRNTNLTGGLTLQTPSLPQYTIDFAYDGSLRFIGDGTADSTQTQGAIVNFGSNADAYGQINLYNTNSGSSASGDYVVTANDGTASTRYIDLGINSSSWTGTGLGQGARNGYLYTQSDELHIFTAADKPLRLGVNNTEIMRVASTGIGIGAATPANNLHVELPSGVSTLYKGIELSRGTGSFKLANGTSGAASEFVPIFITTPSTTIASSMAFVANAGNDSDAGYSIINLSARNKAGSGVCGNTQKAFSITNYTTDLLTVFGSGNVNIGNTAVITNNPKLLINKASGTPSALWQSTNTNMSIFSEGASGNGDLAYYHANDAANARATTLVKRSRGTIASPTTIASGDFNYSVISSVYDGGAFRNTASIEFYADSAVSSGVAPQAVSFWTGETTTRTERMTIRATGNVGIGTTAPAEKLEVSGNIKITGNMLKMTGITTATRDGLTAVAGDIIYNTTTNKHQGYNGSTWNDLY